MVILKNTGRIIDNYKQGIPLPTRHKNPYLEQAISLSQYLSTEMELKHKYNKLFNNINSKIILEIGCYLGKNIAELAIQNTNMNFLGLDITYKRGVMAAKKLSQQNLNNAHIALCDGHLLLDTIVPKHSLAGICVFFPDPWPKEKQKKNRLLNAEFVSKMQLALAQDGFFWFKTDAFDYFQETIKLLQQGNFVEQHPNMNSPQIQPHSIQGGPYETAFQKMFISKNIPYYECVYKLKEGS